MNNQTKKQTPEAWAVDFVDKIFDQVRAENPRLSPAEILEVGVKEALNKYKGLEEEIDISHRNTLYAEILRTKNCYRVIRSKANER